GRHMARKADRRTGAAHRGRARRDDGEIRLPRQLDRLRLLQIAEPIQLSILAFPPGTSASLFPGAFSPARWTTRIEPTSPAALLPMITADMRAQRENKIAGKGKSGSRQRRLAGTGPTGSDSLA